MPVTEGTTATIEVPQVDAAAQAQSAREDAAAAALLDASKDGAQLSDAKLSEVREKLDAKDQTPPKQPKLAEVKGQDKSKKPGPVSGEKAAREARENEAIAKHALRRDKWTDEQIDGLTPDALILTGTKAKERQDEAQQRHDQQNQPTRAGDQSRSDEREGEGALRRPSDPRRSGADPRLDPRSDGPDREELERVLDEYPEEHKEIIGRAVAADLSRAERVVREAWKEADAARAEVFTMRQRVARSTVERDFPQLADESRLAQVEEFMERLEPRDRWSLLPADELLWNYSHAAAAVFGQDAVKASRESRAQQLSDALEGQPRSGGNSTTSPPRMTPQEAREEAAAQGLAKFPHDLAAAERERDRLLGA